MQDENISHIYTALHFDYRTRNEYVCIFVVINSNMQWNIYLEVGTCEAVRKLFVYAACSK